MMSVCQTRVVLRSVLVCVLVCVFDQTLCKRHTINRTDRLSAPPGLELQTVNCTAFRIQWKIPQRHNTITGYRVFYAEMRDGHPFSPTRTLDIPLTTQTLLTGQFARQPSLDVVIGGLSVGAQYSVSVAAYHETAQGRPSLLRGISTASQDVCMPPSPPTQPVVVALSDTELALSWHQGESQDSSPVLYFLVAYIRPEMDSEWTIIHEPVESNSMVLKGLIPQTKYQFIIRSVNQHGVSYPSPVNPPTRTLGPGEAGSGDKDLYTDDVGFGVDSDDDIFIDEADSEDGLLLYCGENELGRGDFMSLSLVRRKLNYRFNCGTGAGQIISDSSVVIGQWHTVTLFRDGVNGWLRLDNDTPVSGHSLGHYAKITFRTSLFVGGAPSVYWLVKTVGTNQGFQGCVQSLSINGRHTDLRPWPQGYALSGADIGECSTRVCDKVVCEHNGVCFPTRADNYTCLCPLGYRGDHCEESFVLSLPRFSESVQSYASAPWPQHPQSYLSFMEFHITFKPTSQDGTLLYSHDEYSRDFLSIVLVGGFLEFHFDCGSGAANIRSEQPVSLNMWHDLRVSRTAKSGMLQVDNQRPVEGSAEGAFTQIKCSSPLYIGGVPDYDSTKIGAGVIRPFSGDIQRITLNDREVAVVTGNVVGVNVMNTPHPCVENPCANGGTCRAKRDEYECDCTLGYDGTHCQKECGNYCFNSVTEAIEIPQFMGRSYLTYDSQEILQRLSGSRTSVFLRFKSFSKDGLLLWIGENLSQTHTDYLSIGLQDGALIFSYDLGSGAVFVVVNGTFSDGKWHRVKAVREGQSGKLTVDDYGSELGRSPGKMRQLNLNGELYIGGMKEIALHSTRQYLAGLVGCVSHFTLSSDYHVSLVEDAANGKNINTCSN
ncbi:pikachurin [Tachysurus ichikawai]